VQHQIEVIDNFLDENLAEYIVRKVDNTHFPWYLIKNVNKESTPNDYQFMHTIVDYGNENSHYLRIIEPLLTNLKKPVKIVRARVNLFCKTETNRGLGFHQDIMDDEEHKTLLYYLEDSNGYTEFNDGQKIESKRNRAVIFDAHVIHQTVTQTDKLFRTNININYTEEV